MAPRGSGIYVLTALLACQALLLAATASDVDVSSIESHGRIKSTSNDWNKSLTDQLKAMGLTVQVAADGQPVNLGAHSALDAYIVPVQRDQGVVLHATGVEEVASFINAGGLVIVMDACVGKGAAMRDFVTRSLGYHGDWIHCKQSCLAGSFRRMVRPSISRWAPAFLPDDATGGPSQWPEGLEEPQVTSVSSWCHHEDKDAVTVPLYNLLGDDATFLVAQAFSRAGTPGAVVWLGYSWKDGPQEQWGSLIRKLVTDFARGAFKVPSEADAEGPLHEADAGDRLVEAVADAAGSGGATADLVRLLLEGAAGVYPPPPSPSPPSSPGSGSSK